MAFSYTLTALASRRGVALRALEDGAPVHIVAVSGPLPTITIDGTPATVASDCVYWHSDGEHVLYFFAETVPDGADVRFTDGGGGLPVVGAANVAYMDHSASSGFRGEHDHIFIGAPSSDVRRRWTFTLPSTGTYSLALTWPHWGDAATNTEFKVWDDTTLVATLQVDQSVQPNDFTESGSPWETVGSWAFATTTFKLELTTNVTNKRIVADGVRVSGTGYLQYGDETAGAGSVAYEVTGGSLPTITNAVVDVSRLGTSNAILSPRTNRSMKIGLNLLGSGDFEDPVLMNADLMKGTVDITTAANSDANGYPTSNSNRAVSAPQAAYDPREFESSIPGTYTLRWDGSGTLSLFDATGSPGPSGDFATISLASETLTGAANNVRTYTVAYAGGNTTWKLNLWVAKNGTVTKWACYPPGVANDGSERWQPSVLEQLRSASCLRPIGFYRTNGAPAIDRADFSSRDDASYAWDAASVRSVAITSIGGYDATDVWINAGWQRYLVTTAANHGLETGQQIRLNREPTHSIVVTLTGGATRDLYNARLVVFVKSATTFVVAMEAGSYTTVATPFTDSGATVEVDLIMGNPFEDYLDVAVQAGTDFYVTIPHAAADACVTAMATETAAVLPAGKVVYVEYSNECWNSLQDFSQRWYVAAMANIQGLISAGASMQTQTVRYYCKRMNEVRTLWRAAFSTAGLDPNRVKMVLGGWWALTDRTSEMAAYCAAQGYTPEALAVAPYTSVHGSDDVNFDCDALDAEQVCDLVEHAMLDFRGYATTIYDTHRSLLDSNGFTAAEIIAYEGSLEGLSRSTVTATNAKQALAVLHHRRMANIIWEYMDVFDTLGMTLFNYFGHFYKPKGALIDGFQYENIGWLAYQGTFQENGVGDGSDGKTNNVAGLSGVPPAYPDLSTFVSTIGYAIESWNAAFVSLDSSVKAWSATSPSSRNPLPVRWRRPRFRPTPRLRRR